MDVRARQSGYPGGRIAAIALPSGTQSRALGPSLSYLRLSESPCEIITRV
jgi:hypothetical protein